MTVTEAIQEVLTEGPTITSLVSASRIRLPGAWEAMARPYITHQPISAGPMQAHDGRVPMIIWDSYQVDVYSDNYSTGEAAANAVIVDLEGTHMVGAASPPTESVEAYWLPGTFYLGHEDDTNLEHFALEFRVAKTLN